MTNPTQRPASGLIARYRQVRAPASLTHNALAAARSRPAPRRWPRALAAGVLIALAALVVLRPDAPSPPARSAQLPALPTLSSLGGRLATLKPHASGALPRAALPALPTIPPTPAPPAAPAAPAAPAVPRDDARATGRTPPLQLVAHKFTVASARPLLV